MKIPITISDDVPLNTIYFLGVASKDEIATGQSIHIGGMDISANPKKHGVIVNVADQRKERP